MTRTITCPCCGNSTSDTVYFTVNTNRKSDQYAQCIVCKAFFLIDDYRVDDEVKHTSETAWGAKKTGIELVYFKKRMFDTIALKLAELKPGSTLLDIGASYGGFSKAGREKGFKVDCTDIVPESIGYLQSQGFTAYNCFSLKDLPETKKYQIICAIDCNYYWPNQYDEIDIIRDRLEENGLFAMRLVSKYWLVHIGLLLGKINEGIGRKVIARAMNDHRHSMSPNALIKLLDKKKFSLVYQSIPDAMHSDQSSLVVKLSFYLGNILLKLFNVYLSPGVFLIFKKNTK